MTEEELRGAIGQQLMDARTYMENEIAAERTKNLRYNLGEPFGNEIEGHSKVVSMDVYDAVESIMPDVMEIFASGPVVRFEPVGPEDEEMAEQVTDYINEVVWRVDNDGYKITFDWSKDTLLEKNGVLKIWWDRTEREHLEELENVSDLELMQYQEAENVEILEFEPSGAQELPDGAGGVEVVETYSVKLKRTSTTGKCCVDVLASEEFGIAAADKALDEHTSFCYHRISNKTRADWIADGFDEDLIYSIPSDDDLISDRSRRTARGRNADQQSSLTQWGSGVMDPAMQRITVHETYPRMDYDGTNEARRYLVWAGGEDGNVLLPDPVSGELATEVADHPFTDMTALRQPHRWAGRALADVMRQIQEVKSTLQRQFLDNCFRINNARAAVSNKVSLEDYLNNEVAGVIEVDSDAPDVEGHIHQLEPNFIGLGILQALEYFDNVGTQRSGVSSTTALDPEALHKTASGANLMLGEMHKRMLYLVRMMAETGFVPAFKKILQVVVDNQDVERTVRLKGKWVTVSPDRWNVDFDVRPVVGLGHGTRTDKVVSANAIIEKQAVLVEQQGGIEGPFVYADNVSNALDLFANNLGVASPEMFFSDPDERPYQPPEPQKDPDVMKAEAEIALKQQESQAKMALERWETEQKIRLQWAELQAKTGLKMEELQNETALEMVKMRTGDPSGQGNIPSVVNG